MFRKAAQAVGNPFPAQGSQKMALGSNTRDNQDNSRGIESEGQQEPLTQQMLPPALMTDSPKGNMDVDIEPVITTVTHSNVVQNHYVSNTYQNPASQPSVINNITHIHQDVNDNMQIDNEKDEQILSILQAIEKNNANTNMALSVQLQNAINQIDKLKYEHENLVRGNTVGIINIHNASQNKFLDMENVIYNLQLQIQAQQLQISSHEQSQITQIQHNVQNIVNNYDNRHIHVNNQHIQQTDIGPLGKIAGGNKNLIAQAENTQEINDRGRKTLTGPTERSSSRSPTRNVTKKGKGRQRDKSVHELANEEFKVKRDARLKIKNLKASSAGISSQDEDARRVRILKDKKGKSITDKI